MTWWSIATSTWWCNAQRQIKRCRRSSASRLFSFLKSSQADTKVSSDGRRKSTFLQWTDCCFPFILEFTGLLPQHSWKKRRSFTWIRWAVRMKIAESSFSSTCESSMKVHTDIVKKLINLISQWRKIRNYQPAGQRSLGRMRSRSKTTEAIAEFSLANSAIIFLAASRSSTSKLRTCKRCGKRFWLKLQTRKCFSEFLLQNLLYLTSWNPVHIQLKSLTAFDNTSK